MPAALKLQEFGSQVWAAFGEPPYQVGSSLKSKKWRDVDVRLILDDVEYERLGFGRPDDQHGSERWAAMVLAFCALGREMTGLPIDFQIQPRSMANKLYPKEPRSALGHVALRIVR